jgi:hypothetical protein
MNPNDEEIDEKQAANTAAAIDVTKFQVEIWDIDNIHPYEKNAKIHTEEQIGRIAESIRKFGWQSVITVNEHGTIIAGHGRRLAAIKLGHKRVPVRVARGLTVDQERALRIVDNKVSEADHDVKTLNEELKDLVNLDFDLSGLIDERELKFLTEDIGIIDFSAITPDIAGDVKSQSESTNKKIEEVDDEEMPIEKIFGFKSIKASKGRKLQIFQAFVEGLTGKIGAAALLEYAKRVDEENADDL